MPKSVAIIMDGNGRWARKRMLPLLAGHRAGFNALKKIISHAQTLGVTEVSVFAFSSENWQRPADEVSDLMQLFRDAIAEESENLRQQNACLRFIGDRSAFNADLRAWMHEAEQRSLSTQEADFKVNVALGYGGRWDLLEAARRLIADGITPDAVNEQNYAERLPSHDIKDVDLLIRTSGEMRISNFLLWQLAYAELYFSPKLWPDFSTQDFDQALQSYSQRQRRFGTRVKR